MGNARSLFASIEVDGSEWFARLSAGCPRFSPAFCRGTRVPGTGAAGCFLAFLFFAFLALAGGLHVDLLGELGQLLVGFLLLFESFLEREAASSSPRMLA